MADAREVLEAMKKVAKIRIEMRRREPPSTTAKSGHTTCGNTRKS